MKQRKLFCEISPMTYKISVIKCQLTRHMKNIISHEKIAKKKAEVPLPILVYEYQSLIRRRLGNTNLALQENKAHNLQLVAPKVTGILVRPGEVFSFWKLVGKCSEKKGYRVGLTIGKGKLSQGIGGGMCQFTNLIHWLVLHTPLDIVEHHHHEGVDWFPDYGRVIPFGTGTSIMYNYLDYRFKNNTNHTYQLIIYTSEEYLHGEIRASETSDTKYHIKVEDEYFKQEEDGIYRTGKVFRECIDKTTGDIVAKELIKTNYAKVMYDLSGPILQST
ncbi:vancomycin resistance protein [Sporanaerobium hydrogeniformans]|uniref:Vancomycin resistance protein n=1 Tax=Sporanaerobium hydrogeniformans TaxID=3072179 RepID=A0AC61DGD1_9FIRM|nr:VanW family protein [Sporanaerobium hydrogeniformans]PHV71858.1 vancomycin resistance protein [Sporanaerobium hydrogeniformans]